MRLLVTVGLVGVLALGLTGCGGASEPGESDMKGALNTLLNSPSPTGVKNEAPIKIDSFKKGACDKPTAQGYNCTFTVSVSSTNMLAQMFNNLPSGVFYKDKDSGKWMMRQPF
jgi:hypothetical protein